MIDNRRLFVFIVLGLALTQMPSQCQQSSQEAQLNKMLDTLDQSNWKQVPISQPVAAPAQYMPPSQNAIVQPQKVPSQRPFEQQFNNPFTPQNILKTFLGGSGSGPGTGKQIDPSAVGSAEGNLQTARDQEQQAVDVCNSIGGQSDKGTRENLASQAQYHANAAREASDRIYSASNNNSNSSRLSDLAAQARAAADRAQEQANRARAKADNGTW